MSGPLSQTLSSRPEPGLDLAEQARSGFTYGYAVYQAEYSRNLLFTIGSQMDKVFGRVVERTRSRLDVPILRTLLFREVLAAGMSWVAPGGPGEPAPAQVILDSADNRGRRFGERPPRPPPAARDAGRT